MLFPSTFTIIDIETTGLSPDYDEIIELSAIKYVNNVAVDEFSSLVRPEPDIDGLYVDSFITELTGITNSMLRDAPELPSILPVFFDFIGNDLVVGHNVNFDINFLYDKSVSILSKPFTNDFVDTMRISRRIHPDISHHRLRDLCDRYSIDYSGAHRALTDCQITAKCLHALHDDTVQLFDSMENFLLYCSSSTSSKGARASDFSATTAIINSDNPLYGKVFVFTGILEKMSRKEAMQIVVNHGGINADNVTKRTNYLVLGNNDYCPTIKDGKSTKQKKAEKLKLDGQDINIIPENIFYDMLDE